MKIELHMRDSLIERQKNVTEFCLLEKLPEKYDNGWGYVTCDWQQIPDNINCCYQLSVPHTYHYPCYLLYTLSDRTFFLNASYL